MKSYKVYSVVFLASVSLSNPPFRACAQVANQAWLQRYGAPASGTNTSGAGATAIAVDSKGNVLVTGDSWNGTNYGYATLKYSNAGTPLWTNRYDGPGNLRDIPRAIAVDQTGNVFVTGFSFLPGSPATVGPITVTRPWRIRAAVCRSGQTLTPKAGTLALWPWQWTNTEMYS